MRMRLWVDSESIISYHIQYAQENCCEDLSVCHLRYLSSYVHMTLGLRKLPLDVARLLPCLSAQIPPTCLEPAEYLSR